MRGTVEQGDLPVSVGRRSNSCLSFTVKNCSLRIKIFSQIGAGISIVEIYFHGKPPKRDYFSGFIVRRRRSIGCQFEGGLHQEKIKIELGIQQESEETFTCKEGDYD
jgi:hypothetical protein